MSDPFLGEIRMAGFNFAPINWAFCDGSVISIEQNAALFSLLGTSFGGNGTTNFNLPDLRGRVPVNQGQGPGLSNYALGVAGGTETVTLIPTQMPQHNHLVNCSQRINPAGTNPVDNLPAPVHANQFGIYDSNASYSMAPNMIAFAGGNEPHPNLQPYLCVNFIICLAGIFPSRS